MAEHLTLVSLRKALSARSNVSEKVADDFLAGLTSTIQEGLQKDGSVTVNGLGTFKLQDMPARESVNVTTGERITIAGHKKVVFVAETKRPLSGSPLENHPTTVGRGAPGGERVITPRPMREGPEPIDPIQKLGEQAEEIKGILSELNAMTSAERPQALTEERPQAKPAERPLTLTEERPQAEPAERAQALTEERNKEEKPFNPWLTGLITIGVFAMLLVIAYFILRHRIVNWADNMRSNIEQRVSTTPEEPAATDVQAVIPAEEPQPTAPAETTEAAPAPVSPWMDDSRRRFTEFLPEETVGQDSRLAWVAKKRYGEKAYWVFIYEVNRDRLSSPDHVLPGMKLRVPKLPKELRDPNDPDTKALLDRLSEKYLR
ncbi:MAG: HU family DNA-binding protein [Paludibacteraceae bacterium]|nr:HU family DNA-binding protein [Paludibacteraceae bacterium]